MSSLELAQKDYSSLHTLSDIYIDLKYASRDNFLGENVYQNFNKAFLHPIAFEMFQESINELKKQKPQWKFIVYDALRPRSIQRILHAKVAGTPEEIYVAHPERGSLHNYGMAIDLSLLDNNNHLVDMGTGFDSFSPLSQPQLEETHFQQGLLTSLHLENRQILRHCMSHSGFTPLQHEWWHFNALSLEEARSKHPIFE